MCYHFESMKSRLLFIPIAAIALSMTGCIFDDNEWRKEYGTPELFLSQVVGDYHSETLLLGEESYGEDNNYEIRDALIEAGPYEARNNKDEGTGRCFTYQAYWQPATTGPNYCLMDVWDNGYLRITHKRSIGFKQYVYFTMDETKATSINTLVREKIEREKQIAEEARAQALIDGAIDNFIAEMEKKTEIGCVVTDKDDDFIYSYFFKDTGDILDLIKTATFSPSETEATYFGYEKLTYNYGEDWLFIIGSHNVPYIEYKYTDSVGRKEMICIPYSIPEAELNAMLARALEIGKATPQTY